MYLTAIEQERLLNSSEQVSEERFGARRWSEKVATTIRTDDGKYYRIVWDSGLTENQEDEFEDGEVLRVYPVESLRVQSRTLYLSDDELAEVKPTLAHKLLADADSYNVATGKNLRDALNQDILDAVAVLQDQIHELIPLDLAGESGAYREATTQYLDAIVALWESE